MNKLIATAFAAASLSIVAIAPSQAIPVAPLAGSPDIVVTVAGGCGQGWHRGPYGQCVRNWAEPRAHACARGWHLAPDGRCRANKYRR